MSVRFDGTTKSSATEWPGAKKSSAVTEGIRINTHDNAPMLRNLMAGRWGRSGQEEVFLGEVRGYLYNEAQS